MGHSNTIPIDKDELDVEQVFLIHLPLDFHHGYRDETSEMQESLELSTRSF